MEEITVVNQSIHASTYTGFGAMRSAWNAGVEFLILEGVLAGNVGNRISKERLEKLLLRNGKEVPEITLEYNGQRALLFRDVEEEENDERDSTIIEYTNEGVDPFDNGPDPRGVYGDGSANPVGGEDSDAGSEGVGEDSGAPIETADKIKSDSEESQAGNNSAGTSGGGETREAGSGEASEGGSKDEADGAGTRDGGREEGQEDGS